MEKASCSGWLVNRGVTLPCGSQSVGKSQPTDSTCTFLSLMFTARRSLEITGILYFFPFVFVLSLQKNLTAGERTHLHLGSGRQNRVSVRLGGRTVMTKLRPRLSWRVSKSSSRCFAVSRRSPLKLEASSQTYEKKTLCHVNVLHSLDLRCTFV